MIGTSVFKGLGKGIALVYEPVEMRIPTNTLDSNEIILAKDRLTLWIEERKSALEKDVELVKATIGVEESQILLAHIEILNDPELMGQVLGHIDSGMNLATSMEKGKTFFVEILRQVDNDYIRERAKDIEDVMNGLIRLELGITDNPLKHIQSDTIIFAKDLTPSDTILLTSQVKGIVLTDGSLTSHTAIVAKAKGIPTIVGYIGEQPKAEDIILLDSIETTILINPDESALTNYDQKLNESLAHQEILSRLKDEKAITRDGRIVKLFGNVGSVEDATSVSDNGGSGIGLLRTELVYMDSNHWPTMDEQYKVYKKIAEEVQGEVIIRTLDIGGDKNLPYYDFKSEENPFLGLRAVRFCLKNPDIFKVQLKSILKASYETDIRVMFPMIGSVEEFLDAKAILLQSMAELKADSVQFNEDIKVGVMIEIPAAVFAMDKLAEHVDFVSIGTNDLCQYTLAVDRLNSDVAYLYDSNNISILRMIHHVVKICHMSDIEVGVCGEMAGDVDSAKVLIGLGVDELSVAPVMIPSIKEMILKSSYEVLTEEAMYLVK